MMRSHKAGRSALQLIATRVSNILLHVVITGGQKLLEHIMKVLERIVERLIREQVEIYDM